MKQDFNDTYTQIGRYANGDYWVVGPIYISEFDPESIVDGGGRTENGTMVNMTSDSQQGWDSEGPGFSYALNKAMGVNDVNTLYVDVNSMLLISESVAATGQRPTIQVASTLTVLSAPALDGDFRPGIMASSYASPFNVTDINYDALADLASVPNSPTIASLEDQFKKPWFVILGETASRFIHPEENMPDYYGDMADRMGKTGLILNENYTDLQKKTALVRFLQCGIDHYEIVNRVGTNSDRHRKKMPILFAGMVFGSADYKNVDDLPNTDFKEDTTTFYVEDVNDVFPQPYNLNHWRLHTTYGTQTGTVTVVNGSPNVVGSGTSWAALVNANMFGVKEDKEAYEPNGHSAYDIQSIVDDTNLVLTTNYAGDSNSGLGYKLSDYLYYGHGEIEEEDFNEYTAAHIGMPDWGIAHEEDAKRDTVYWLSQPYRRNTTSPTWNGMILTMHIMGGKAIYDHNAMFDYMDRYMDNEEFLGNTGTSFRSSNLYMEDMWDTYRSTLGTGRWVSDDLNDLASNGSYVAW
jgi:hypothetical protein